MLSVMRREYQVAQIERPIDLMQQGCQFEKRSGFEAIEASQIRDINRVGPQHLAQGRVRVVIQHERLVCAPRYAQKAVEHESVAS